jgi:hypothetical protein
MWGVLVSIYTEVYKGIEGNIILNKVRFFDVLRIVKVNSEQNIAPFELEEAKSCLRRCIQSCENAILQGYKVELQDTYSITLKEFKSINELSDWLFKGIDK